MSSSSERVIRASLWATAPLNLVAAVTFAVPAWGVGPFLQLPQEAHPLYTILSGAMIGLFGAVYVWLALQDNIHRPLLLIGACGKSLAVVIAVGLFAHGDLSGTTTVVLAGDAAFAALWFHWLSSSL
ncbi:MAG: hypothetical protein P8Y69_03780 [Gammaproteobacteria bacterium]|jgi:hypothetical protein